MSPKTNRPRALNPDPREYATAPKQQRIMESIPMSATRFSTARNIGKTLRNPLKSGTLPHASALMFLSAVLVAAFVGIGTFLGVTQFTNPGADSTTKAAMPRAAAQDVAPATRAKISPISGIQWTAPAQAQPNAASVVRAYFDAINSGISNGDFVAAWALGGKNISGLNYDSFVASFSSTVNDNVTIDGVVGNKVSIQLDATQADGSHRFFSGTYTVQNGTITAANINRV